MKYTTLVTVVIRKTQTQLVLDYMREHDGITSIEAVRDLGITRLAARIADIESAGGTLIARDWETGLNRFGVKSSWIRYRLNDKR